MKIITSAPTRIDLAGGTLDIYPLYIFEDCAVTVNIAIDLKSMIEINVREDKKITVFSEDIKKEIKADSLEVLPDGGAQDLIVRTIKFYKPKVGMDITTRNTVPSGSGLGASSSLLMSLSSALNAISRKTSDNLDLINWGANLEARSLNVPTGKQDYYAAIYGGVNAIWFNIEGARVESIILTSSRLKELEKSLILSYTGMPHFSGTHNWDMMKLYIDKNKTTRQSMGKIKNIAFKMREALLAGDIEKISYILDMEWENRKCLAKGVTNKKIDMLMLKAKKEGALASKICGAGGGGCMITIAPPEKTERVVEALKLNGAQVLDFKIDFEGLKVYKS